MRYLITAWQDETGRWFGRIHDSVSGILYQTGGYALESDALESAKRAASYYCTGYRVGVVC